MSTFVTLLDEDYIKAVCPVDINIETENLTPCILYAQNEHILELVGTGIYNELVSQTDSDSLTDANMILLTGYCKMCLAQWVVYEYLPFAYLKITNTGLQKRKEQNADGANESDVEYLREKVKNLAEFYGERMLKFLQANPNTYPLYGNPGNSIDTVPPKTSAYSTGMFIPGMKGQFFPRNKGRNVDINYGK